MSSPKKKDQQKLLSSGAPQSCLQPTGDPVGSLRSNKNQDKHDSGRPGTSKRLNCESNDCNLTDYNKSYGRYAGLRNGGSTCYMNSVLQQLYHTPGISQDLVMSSSARIQSVFHQTQKLFECLDNKMYPQMQDFWRVYKLWGEPIKTAHQHDAFEFFVDVISQLDDHLIETKQKEVFKPRFQGVFSDIKECKGCTHSYTSEEEFLALSLTVQPEKSLEAGLEQFVQGVKLKGENAYMCDECGIKRTAIKTMCIKTLPPVLVIHLKRIKMDWKTGRATKFNDYFQFPRFIDMGPYTLKGIKNKERNKHQHREHKGIKRDFSALNPDEEQLYQLVGVVIHSGQANAGHYYSLIKDRHGSKTANPTKGKWFKFNDTLVEEYVLTDDSLASECFGGSDKWYSSLRSNSGYMLFYEKIDRKDLDSEPQTKPNEHGGPHMSTKKRHTTSTTSAPDHLRSITTAQLSEKEPLSNAHQKRDIGDKSTELPPDIQTAIHSENKEIKRNDGIQYGHLFAFIQSLRAHDLIPPNSTYSELTSEKIVTSIENAVKLLPRKFANKSSIGMDELTEWCTYIKNLLKYSTNAWQWAVKFMSDQKNYKYILMYLIEFHDVRIRQIYSEIVISILHSTKDFSMIDRALKVVLSLLDKEVPSHAGTCAQYFITLKEYLSRCAQSEQNIQTMLQLGAFQFLMTFLIGLEEDPGKRRWTSQKAKEFAPHIHFMLAAMIISCDVASLRPNDYRSIPYLSRKMPEDMKEFLSGVQRYTYIRESLLALCEHQEVRSKITLMLLHCCDSNHDFSVSTLKEIQRQIETAPVDHLQPLFDTLLELLLLKDSLQRERLKIAVEDENNLMDICMKLNREELWNVCMKLFDTLADECQVLEPVAKNWQEATKTLKTKMTDAKLAKAMSLLTLPLDDTRRQYSDGDGNGKSRLSSSSVDRASQHMFGDRQSKTPASTYQSHYPGHYY